MKQLLIQSQRKFIFHFMLPIINLFLCRHLDDNSVRLFNKQTPSNRAIANFSARHKSHFCELHLEGIAFVFMRHFKLSSLLLSFSDQICFDNSVRCLYPFEQNDNV